MRLHYLFLEETAEDRQPSRLASDRSKPGASAEATVHTQSAVTTPVNTSIV